MEIYTVKEAKNQFPKLHRLAAQGLEFIVVGHETPPVSLIATGLLNKITNNSLSTLTYEWLDKPGDIISGNEVNKTWNLWNHQLRILGVGETKEEAIQSLAEDAINYAIEYFNNFDYFLKPLSERDDHYWILRGIIHCKGDFTKVIEVMRLKKAFES